ncbi:hypothetical protein DAERI_020388 [Deinococcus aerius]|uniref:Uncharacterized protein n=1 Tax=Deinococcus aerius TaxID=200253 RepID=A0A2I9DJ38_9DEIO|nr:hypothetical protein DAERI_020388 [Deinococcus aerius]
MGGGVGRQDGDASTASVPPPVPAALPLTLGGDGEPCAAASWGWISPGGPSGLPLLHADVAGGEGRSVEQPHGSEEWEAHVEVQVVDARPTEQDEHISAYHSSFYRINLLKLLLLKKGSRKRPSQTE